MYFEDLMNTMNNSTSYLYRLNNMFKRCLFFVSKRSNAKPKYYKLGNSIWNMCVVLFMDMI